MAKKHDIPNFSDVISQFGKVAQPEYLSTGIPDLDKILGGGIARPYMLSMWGDPGAGKSSVVFQIIKSVLDQKASSGGKVVFLDVEKALNERQAECFKLQKYIDSGNLIVLVVDSIRDAEIVVDSIVAGNGSDVVLFVIDSTTALAPFTKQELTVEDVRPGLHALQITHVINKMKNGFYACNVASILICQARANISMGGPVNPYAPQNKSAGGYAERHTPDIVMKVQAGSSIKDGNGDGASVIGNEVTFLCEKNKFAPPKTPVKKSLIYGRGVSVRYDVIETALKRGLISQAGAIFTLPDGTKIKGKQPLYDLPNETIIELRDSLWPKN